MRDLKIGEVVRFSAIDDFSGKEMELIGTVTGDYKEVRKRYPEECGEAPGGFYLVKVGDRSGLFVVSRDEVLKSLGKKEKK